jgi:MFS family permease
MGAAMNRAYKLLHPVRRNHALLLAHNGLQSMLFVLPVIVPYYHDVLGLGFNQFLIGEVVFSTVIVLMEVPAGWLADVWQRRLMLMTGSLIEACGFLLLLHAHSFGQAVFAQGAIGVGVSMVSGTNTALLYDTLLFWRRTKAFRKLEGMRHGMGLYVVGGASLAGGFLYGVDPKLPLTLSVGCYLLAALAAFLMVEPVRDRQKARRNPLLDILQTVKFAVHGHPDIGALILFCGILFGTTQAGVWVQQPYYLARGLDRTWFGVLAFAGFLLAGAASQHSHRLEKSLARGTAFGLVLYGVAGSYLVSGILPGLWGIPFLYASSVAFGFGMPLVQDVINGRIASGRRASIVSTASLAGRLVFIPAGWLVAEASTRYGIDRTVSGMGVFLILSGSLALWQLRRANVFAARTAVEPAA